MNEMMTMWAMFALLTVLAILFVVVPFLRKESILTLDHDANAERIDIYHQRLEELNQDLNSQRIEQTVHDESILELKQRLYHELSPEKQLNSRGNNRIFALTGVAFTLAVSGVFYSFTGSQTQIENWYEAIDKLPEYGERAVMQQGEPLSQNELQAFALGLRTKLANSGDDAVAWMLLGRVAMSLNDYTMAKQAFDKALQMNPDNNNILVNYSQVLLVEGSDTGMNQAASMLSKVLQSEPSNIDAISLLALIAYERKDWVEAKTAFEVLLSTMTDSDPRYSMISQRIAEIDGQLSDEKQQTIGEMTGPSLAVTVTLADNLTKSVPENATLFVFAKAIDGPKMPLAVEKLTDFNLPLMVTLDDSMAMMPNLKLSNFEQVVITARISVDNSVTISNGELEGQSEPITLTGSAQNHTVEISHVITSTGS
ncbi:c-type cytochrome biogenesis protein CcmI [Pseudoalteromonas sp. MSK9-3]|nr:c-type cytochrome biogenesis protein CcmI [Pseudoalteromonas sp. MSK9-3]